MAPVTSWKLRAARIPEYAGRMPEMMTRAAIKYEHLDAKVHRVLVGLLRRIHLEYNTITIGGIQFKNTIQSRGGS